MDFQLVPPRGVGSLLIGMQRQEADAALLSLRDPAVTSDSDRPGQHIFRPSGLMISISCTRGLLEAVELGRPPNPSDSVRFGDVDVFGLPAREVVRRMRDQTTVLADAEDPASFVAPDLPLSLWRPFASDDDPEEEQGYYFSSVLLSRPGYYDGPGL